MTFLACRSDPPNAGSSDQLTLVGWLYIEDDTGPVIDKDYFRSHEIRIPDFTNK